MPIHLIIDGYNVIGRTEGLGNDLEGRRRRLIDRLSTYRRNRLHNVTVVFDGTKGGKIGECSSRIGGLEVVFSRAGETADEVIRRMAKVEGSACVIVSSDRAVQSSARQSGAVWMDVDEFDFRLRMAKDVPDSGGSNDDEENGRSGRTHKKGNPRRLSKSEREKRRRVKKV